MGHIIQEGYLMFKKYLLSTVAVIALTNMSYAMDLEDGEVLGQIFYVGPNKLPQGIRPGDVDVHLMFRLPNIDWSKYTPERLTAIINKGVGIPDDRLGAFNYLRNWIHENRYDERVQEIIVTNTMLFAGLLLWDEPSRKNNEPQLNDVLTKLIVWEESYLSEVDDFLNRAMEIQKKKIQQNCLLDKNDEEVRRAKRVEATLTAYLTRLKQLSLFMDKKNGTYDDVDPDHSRRREIYNGFDDARKGGASKLCLFEMTELLSNVWGYSATGNRENDEKLRIDLLRRYDQLKNGKAKPEKTSRKQEVIPIIGRIPIPKVIEDVRDSLRKAQTSLSSSSSESFDEERDNGAGIRESYKRKRNFIYDSSEDSDVSEGSSLKGVSDVTPEIEAQFKSLWEDSKSASKTAKKLGFNRSAVNKFFDMFELGDGCVARKLTQDDISMIQAEKAKGTKSRVISRQLKIPTAQVDHFYNRKIKEAHIPQQELSSSTKDMIISLHNEGKGPKRISAVLFTAVGLTVNSNQIELFVRNYDINEIPARDLTLKDQRDIVKLKNEGKEPKEISEKLHINRRQVTKCNKISHRLQLQLISENDGQIIKELHNTGYSRDRIVSEQKHHLGYDNYEEGKIDLYTEKQIRDVLEMGKQIQPKKRVKIAKPAMEKATKTESEIIHDSDEAEWDEDSL